MIIKLNSSFVSSINYILKTQFEVVCFYKLRSQSWLKLAEIAPGNGGRYIFVGRRALIAGLMNKNSLMFIMNNHCTYTPLASAPYSQIYPSFLNVSLSSEIFCNSAFYTELNFLFLCNICFLSSLS